MRVFVTGASGFLGSYVVRQLIENRHSIAILVRPNSNPWRIADIVSSLTVVAGDLDHPDCVFEQLSVFAPEAVLHLGWAGVENRFHNVSEQDLNTDQILHLLEMCVRLGVGTWIGLGSQAEYGPSDRVIDEGHETNPLTNYGRNKLASGQLADRFCNSHGIRFVWLRLFTAYGPMDNPSWFIPSIALTLLSGKEPEMTAGTQVMDFLYVADAADAIVRIMEDDQACGIFNLASGSESTVLDVAEKIRELINRELRLSVGAIAIKPDQVNGLRADTTRLRDIFGWHPVTPLSDGLEKTVHWYRNNLHRYL